MKRAAVIKIYRLLQEDPPYWRTDTDEMPHLLDGTGEKLLADLRTLAHPFSGHPRFSPWTERELDDARARVRALLPEEGEDG